MGGWARGLLRVRVGVRGLLRRVEAPAQTTGSPVVGCLLNSGLVGRMLWLLPACSSFSLGVCVKVCLCGVIAQSGATVDESQDAVPLNAVPLNTTYAMEPLHWSAIKPEHACLTNFEYVYGRTACSCNRPPSRGAPPRTFHNIPHSRPNTLHTPRSGKNGQTEIALSLDHCGTSLYALCVQPGKTGRNTRHAGQLHVSVSSSALLLPRAYKLC